MKQSDDFKDESGLSSKKPLVMDKYGGIEIDVSHDKTRRPDKRFASIFFEPKVKAVKLRPIKKNPIPTTVVILFV